MRYIICVCITFFLTMSCSGMMQQRSIPSKEEQAAHAAIQWRVNKYVLAQWDRLFATRYSYRACASCLRLLFCLDTGDE